ncbi:hypothetical protein U1Q18_004740 [Sarracenia purpurea var. burkii]
MPSTVNGPEPGRSRTVWFAASQDKLKPGYPQAFDWRFCSRKGNRITGSPRRQTAFEQVSVIFAAAVNENDKKRKMRRKVMVSGVPIWLGSWYFGASGFFDNGCHLYTINMGDGPFF